MVFYTKRRIVLLIFCYSTSVTIMLAIYCWYGGVKSLNLLEYSKEVSNSVEQSSSAYYGESKSKTYSSDIRMSNINSSTFQNSDTQRKFRNLPYKLLGKIPNNSTDNCVQLPKLIDIKFNNIYWQVFSMPSDIDYFLYSAYYDNRPLTQENPVVRVITMKSGSLNTNKIYCQMWFDEGTRLVISVVSDILKLGNYINHFTKHHPFMLSCQIPLSEKGLIPNAVSLVEQPCDNATNLLRVVHKVPKGEKKNFAVCVKGLDFPYYDMSKYLAEWIELLHILGVHKIFIYKYGIHPNMSKVLQYYMSLGLVEVIPLTLPGYQPNLFGIAHSYLTQYLYIKREHEVLPYNDCFYMNMYRYKYIAMLDTDEVIMPRKHNTWKELIDYIISKRKNNTNEDPAYYTFRNVISLDSMRHQHGWEPTIPSYMYILQNVYRSDTYDKVNKSILDTSRVIKVFNHWPEVCEGRCRKQSVHTDLAHVWHYRDSCKTSHRFACKNNNVTKDTEIYRFKDELIAKTSRTLRLLNLIEDEGILG